MPNPSAPARGCRGEGRAAGLDRSSSGIIAYWLLLASVPIVAGVALVAAGVIR